MQGRIQEFLPISQGISGRLHNLGPIRSCLEQLLLPPFGSPEHVGPALTFRADRMNSSQLEAYVQKSLRDLFNITRHNFHSTFIEKSVLTEIPTKVTDRQPRTYAVFQSVGQPGPCSISIGLALSGGISMIQHTE